MAGPRPTIGGMLGLIALAAVGLAALRNPSEHMAALTLNLCVGILIWGTVEARQASGPAADFWFGFALVGWPHLLLTPVRFVRDWLATDFGLLYLLELVPHEMDVKGKSDLHLRLMIAHHLASIGLGLVGGWAFDRWRGRSRPDDRDRR